MKFKFIIMLFSIILITGCELTMEDLGFHKSYGTDLTITKEKYNRIKTGDTYFQVKSIIGGECTNYYSDDNEDWYSCIDDENPSKRIVLGFENGKLKSKSSSGLN